MKGLKRQVYGDFRTPVADMEKFLQSDETVQIKEEIANGLGIAANAL